jgi:NAD(P)H-nitrite reductase large subunit
MRRCECAEVGFHEVARLLERDGLTPDEACRRTGCGRLCGACIPDLERHLATR